MGELTDKLKVCQTRSCSLRAPWAAACPQRRRCLETLVQGTQNSSGRLLTSALPCWKLLASPVQSGVLSSCRAAARTLLKLFFRRRAHEKVREFWSWLTAPMGGGWLGFVRLPGFPVIFGSRQRQGQWERTRFAGT